METIKDAIKESIATQNPINLDTVIGDVLAIFSKASVSGIRTEACKLLRDGGYQKVRIDKSRRFQWCRKETKETKDACADCKHLIESKSKPNKEALTMPQVGEAMVAYISDLKTRIQALADQVSQEQTARKQVRDNLEGQVENQTQIIRNLNKKLIAANKRVHNDNHGKTFNLKEVAHFAKQ